MILFIALALFVGAFFVTNKTYFSPRAGSEASTYAKIQSDDDLDRANTTLSNVDLNSIDSSLNQNDQDVSSL